MSLNCVVVNINDLNELLKCDIPDVVMVLLFVCSLLLKELAQDVDAEHPKAAAGLNLHDSLDALSKHRDAWLLCVFGVGGNLGEDIAHLVAGL